MSFPHSRGGRRGSGAFYGSFRGKNGSSFNKRTGHAIVEPMGKHLHTIRPEHMASTIPQDTKQTIEQCEYIASYNWIESKSSEILVPGSPPAWTPPPQEMKLPEDSGVYYRDVNAARYPPFPMEPSLRALFHEKPNFETSAVDIFGCGNTFGSLLSACRSDDDRSFCFGVEKIGKTVFLDRQTPPKEEIENVYGYGHSFPDAYTTWPRDVKGSVSHQRLIQYEFGGIRCVIRSESDGYLPETIPPPPQNAACTTRETSLEDATNKLNVSMSLKPTENRLSVQFAGRKVPQEAVFDLKTRSSLREIDVEEFLPRLWVNQTPNFILARHRSGKFKSEDIQIIDVRSKVRRWENVNQDVLMRFQAVLRKLIQITSGESSSRVQVHRMGLGPLQITKPTKLWTVLPLDLRTKWEGKKLAVAQSEEKVLQKSDSEDEDDDYLKF